MNIRKVVAVIVLNPEDKFIILKRTSDNVVHANLWNLPSGGIENDESLEKASVREVLEETSLNIFNIQTGPKLLIKVNDNTSLEINYLLSRTKDTKVLLNKENTEFKWVTPAESLNYKFAAPKKEVIRILKYFNYYQ